MQAEAPPTCLCNLGQICRACPFTYAGGLPKVLQKQPVLARRESARANRKRLLQEGGFFKGRAEWARQRASSKQVLQCIRKKLACYT